ncbi:MAG: nucleoside-diphosphate kinase [Candidatus Rokubacteria bacterium]|nr:nucleoside-diphosphate kinase [Candidatus Rokubacteria bacterium]
MAGRILARIEESDFTVLAAKMLHMTEAQARGFYIVHERRPFFRSLVTFMMQGPSIVLVLEADNAIARWRDLMGATDPAQAAAGTIRKEFASSIEANAVHGSDSPESAATEIPYFFSALEIWAR